MATTQGSSSRHGKRNNDILAALHGALVGGGAGLATEANQTTMIGILNSILNENNADFEFYLVEDNVGDLFLMRQTLEDDGTIVTDYVDATGTVAVPVAPVSFISANAILSSILASTQGVERTPNYIRASAAGSIPAGSKDISIFNAGQANATVLGEILEPGFQIPFGTDGNDTSSAIAYDGTGTTLLITYMS